MSTAATPLKTRVVVSSSTHAGGPATEKTTASVTSPVVSRRFDGPKTGRTCRDVANPVMAQRLAKVLGLPFHAQIGGRVPQTGDAEGRVDQETGQCDPGLLEFQLQQVVGEVVEFKNVVDEFETLFST